MNNSDARETSMRLTIGIQKGKIGFGVLLFIVFIVGCLVGLVTSSYLYYQHVFSKMVDQNAIDLGWQVRTVSQLRLGEIDDVINYLEISIDSNIRSMAQTPHIQIEDYRYKTLRAAKTYREIYPSQSQNASQVNDALRKIPKFEKFDCQGPLYRLVEKAEENNAK